MNIIDKLLVISKEIGLLFRWQDIIDIVIVTVVVYYFLLLIKETRALQMLRGLAILLVVALFAGLFELHTINWILRNLFTVGLVALVILFQPEIRRALIELGRTKFFSYFFYKAENEVYHAIAMAAKSMINRKIGGLLVIERGTSLKNYIETGVHLDSEVSVELIMSIFYPNSPLHDGALIIKGGRIAAAGCILPITQSPNLSKELGLRHRAAVGVTEETDSIVVVISEEKRLASLSLAGKLIPAGDSQTLEEMLVLYGPKMEV